MEVKREEEEVNEGGEVRQRKSGENNVEVES